MLNTLKLDWMDFKKLLENSENNYTLLKQNSNAKLIELLNLKNKTPFDSEDEELIEENFYDENVDFSRDVEAEELRNNFNKNEIMMKALEKNPALLKEDFFKTMLKNISKSKVQNYKIGRILAKGKIKLLSGDLLYLLKYLAGQKDDLECLKTNQFYAPLDNYVNGKEYAIFRNPHISRNEHVVAKSLVMDKNSERERYLGHLQGVVMINPIGFFAERLGGADYDGDIVKIVEDETFIDGARFSNQMDLLRIPGIKSEPKFPNDTNCFNTVIDTFSNRVGLFSNYAFKNAVIAYNLNSNISDEEREEYEMKVRELAILTGLEIDSAKNGKKPYLDKKRYEVKFNDNENDFLDYKKNILENKSSKGKIKIKEDSSNIERISLQFEELENTNLKLSSKVKNMPVFKNFENIFDENLKNKSLALIFACKAVTKSINLRIFKNKIKNTNEEMEIKQIKKILLETHSFDYVANKIKNYENAFYMVGELDALRIFLKRIKDFQWEFTPKELRFSTFKKIIEGYEEYFENLDDYKIFFDFRKKGYNLLTYSIRYALNTLFKEECNKNQENCDAIAISKKNLKKAILKYDEGIDEIYAELCIDEIIDLFRRNPKVICLKKDFKTTTDLKERLELFKAVFSDISETHFKMLSFEIEDKNPIILKAIKYFEEYSNVIDAIGKDYFDFRIKYFKELINCVSENQKYTKNHIEKVYKTFRNKMIDITGSAENSAKICILLKEYDKNQNLLWSAFPIETYDLVQKSSFKIPLKSNNGNFIYEFENYKVDEKIDGDDL